MAILIPPAAARAFRVVAGKCRATRSRDPALQVLARVRAGTLNLFSRVGEVGLSLKVPNQIGSGSQVLPLDALERSADPEVSVGPEVDKPAPPALPTEMTEV